MDATLLAWLLLAVAVVALLYSSVGHAGASGYIAVMTLAGLAPAEIRPLALALNVVVASIATWQFWRAGHFSWRLFWPFALAAMPMAALGGSLDVPLRLFQVLVGIVLLLSALQLLLRKPAERAPRPPSTSLALVVGALLGLLAGLTGTGGGIFLTPLLVLSGWARAPSAAAVSAPFILLNSSAGLLGLAWGSGGLAVLPVEFPAFVVAVVGGGLLGSWLGSHRLPGLVIRRLLAAVLVVAGLKLLLT
ncbi:TSUP family transporter [Arenimonas sp.]|uniref:TSUP family transporter n=1 Tax=Arenimonas sp. TaxID=1872635 RepID=UPI0025F8500E|nr:TSUP family transporter [Arenimonas sp.]